MISRLLSLYCVAFLLTGCAAPETLLNREAERLHLTRSVVEGTEFQHLIYFNKTHKHNGELHVYLDGDGSPWLRHRFVSGNPTPRNPLVLRLMAQDPVSSVYLGRPCYFGFGTKPPCSAILWTNQRYSNTVIDSMIAALRKIRHLLRPKKTVLIGFSGGGALAMLMAERLEDVGAIVTIAGNLDPDAWAERHHYAPLTGSENPARHPPLPGSIFQLHLAGEKDANVSPDLISSALQHQPSPRLIVLPDADHDCCWEPLWPSILKQIDAASP